MAQHFAICVFDDESGEYAGLDLRMTDTRITALREQPEFAGIERQRDELLSAARAAADLLTRQKWNPDDTFNPEAVVLRGLLDAIQKAEGR